MKKTILRGITLIGIGVFIVSGCSSAFFTTKAFQYIDKDKSQELSYDEYHYAVSTDADYRKTADASGLSVEEYCKKDFKQADTNNDKYISLEEFQNSIKKLQ